MVDLSYDLNKDTMVWPGSGEGFSLCMHTEGTGDTFYSAGTFTCAEHSGTHIDAPIHFSEHGISVEQIQLQKLVGPCVVIDVSAACNLDSNYAL